MSFLSRAARTSTPWPLAVGTARADGGQPGRYLTDGVNLYRHLGAIPSGMGEMIGLENCRTLEVMLLPIGQLNAWRAVTPCSTW